MEVLANIPDWRVRFTNSSIGELVHQHGSARPTPRDLASRFTNSSVLASTQHGSARQLPDWRAVHANSPIGEHFHVRAASSPKAGLLDFRIKCEVFWVGRIRGKSVGETYGLPEPHNPKGPDLLPCAAGPTDLDPRTQGPNRTHSSSKKFTLKSTHGRRQTGAFFATDRIRSTGCATTNWLSTNMEVLANSPIGEQFTNSSIVRAPTWKCSPTHPIGEQFTNSPIGEQFTNMEVQRTNSPIRRAVHQLPDLV